MIERVIAISVRHRWLVVGAAGLLAIAGVAALHHTPVDAIPDLSEDQLVVFAAWPGHSPPQVEEHVTHPLSLALQGLAGVKTVRGSSDFGFCMLNLILEEGTDPAQIRHEVEQRLTQHGALLPEGVRPELAPDAAATGQIFWYTLEGTGYDLGRLRAMQEWYVKPQLASISGVAEVASVGGFVAEYQVVLDPQRLAAHGLMPGDVSRALASSAVSTGGHVVQWGPSEYVVQALTAPGSVASAQGAAVDSAAVVRELEQVVIPTPDGRSVSLGELAEVRLGPAPRRGVLEKDGNEVVGGIVLMRRGAVPLQVIADVRAKLHELEAALPSGMALIPAYDRTPLIRGALGTVSRTVAEAMLAATILVVLILWHVRASLVIVVTPPLAALAAFAALWGLRRLGLADVQLNIMSLAGIAVSIGVLVDAAIVMAENVLHVRSEAGGGTQTGAAAWQTTAAACSTVGRPMFFAVLIMLLSFLPVFALRGMEGKMFTPLAWTKSLAMAAAGLLALTLVPALCAIVLKGCASGEQASPLVRGVFRMYRPVLNSLLERPAPLAWVLGVTAVLACRPTGYDALFRITVFGAALVCGCLAVRWWSRVAAVASVLLVGLAAERCMQPLGYEFMVPLDEGMVMDMPITVPRAGVTQSADDLKARDMVLCRFPEVAMVLGKAGRAETPLDPAPLDMIETMIEFRPEAYWPARKLHLADARRQAQRVLDELRRAGLLDAVAAGSGAARDAVQDAAAANVHDAIAASDAGQGAATALPAAELAAQLDVVVEDALEQFDRLMREYAYQRNQEFMRDLGRQIAADLADEILRWCRRASGRSATAAERLALLGTVPPGTISRLAAGPDAHLLGSLGRHLVDEAVRLKLAPSAEAVWATQRWSVAVSGFTTWLGVAPDVPQPRLWRVASSSYDRRWRRHVRTLNGELHSRAAETWTRLLAEQLLRTMASNRPRVAEYLAHIDRQRTGRRRAASTPGHHHQAAPLPVPRPLPELEAACRRAAAQMAACVWLSPVRREELVGFGGELDRALQMPGWANVWTMPIQNRVDMLATGVNTAIGVRVVGPSFDEVVQTSEAVADVLRKLPGATDVVADPVRGKGYLEIRLRPERAARLGVTAAAVAELVETATGGRQLATLLAGRERRPVRLRLLPAWRDELDRIKQLPVRARSTLAPSGFVPLGEVADVRLSQGPATIKSENGLPRNYVRLNVRGQSAEQFVAQAKDAVAREVNLPAGVFVQWTGQFEHQTRTRRTLWLLVPIVVLLAALVLYWTYRDLADMLLALCALPGGMCGGVLVQWILGFKFSVTVWVGYIACLGMATSTAVIMLVYLRQALAAAGPLHHLTLPELREAVLRGAAWRLRPKLLTEGTTLLSLAPMLWASGTGAEIIRPMAAPVLGGILVADEVIDMLLPVLFYHVRRRRWLRAKRQLDPLALDAPRDADRVPAPEPHHVVTAHE